MTRKTYFGKNIDRYIEFSEEEKKFIREFKLLLLDGLKVKKYCKTFGFVFRNLSMNYNSDRLEWNSVINTNAHIHFSNILSIGDSDSIKYSDLKRKRIVVILHRLEYGTKETIFELADEETKNLFSDGLKLLVNEFRHKNKS